MALRDRKVLHGLFSEVRKVKLFSSAANRENDLVPLFDFGKRSFSSARFRYGELRTAPFTVVVTSTSPKLLEDTALDAFIIGYSNVTQQLQEAAAETVAEGSNLTNPFIFPPGSSLAGANDTYESEEDLEDRRLLEETGISKEARAEYARKFFVLKVRPTVGNFSLLSSLSFPF